MRWLLFLSRVAFICNIFFVLAFCLQLGRWLPNEHLAEMIIILGYILGFIFNPIVNLCYLITVIISRQKIKIVPAWLLTANILFLVMQVLYIFYLNDTQHS
jgi:hypothetical protein